MQDIQVLKDAGHRYIGSNHLQLKIMQNPVLHLPSSARTCTRAPASIHRKQPAHTHTTHTHTPQWPNPSQIHLISDSHALLSCHGCKRKSGILAAEI